ncbi:hypothetical protein BJX66DRAFT_296969, partial [Aspergillus keveii]
MTRTGRPSSLDKAGSIGLRIGIYSWRYHTNLKDKTAQKEFGDRRCLGGGLYRRHIPLGRYPNILFRMTCNASLMIVLNVCMCCLLVHQRLTSCIMQSLCSLTSQSHHDLI